MTPEEFWGFITDSGLTMEQLFVTIYDMLQEQGGALTVGKFLGLK